MSGRREYGQAVPSASAVLDETSRTACALAAGPGQALLGWTGSDFRLNVLWSTDGQGFGGKQTLAHRSSRTVQSSSTVGNDGVGQTSTTTEPLAPALAVARQGRFVAWTGTDGRLNVGGADLPGSGHTVLPERSANPPALAPWGDELALAWTGTDRRLNVAWTQGGTFGGPLTLDETSMSGPALAGAGDELALAWTGTDRRLNLLVTQGGQFAAPPWVLDHTSRCAPALCGVDGLLVVGWTGGDRRLNLLTVAPGHLGRPTLVPARSDSSPALAALDGSLVVAWTGGDRHLNVARMARPT